MQNKKLYIIIPLAVILIAAAAFVGGRLLNGQANPLGLFPMGNGDTFVSFEWTQAPELPTQPEAAIGMIVERKDNTFTIQVNTADHGVSIEGVPVGADSGDSFKVEVVVTNATKIYNDITEEPHPSSGNVIVQQVVEAGTLDDLNNNVLVAVWGRKNGDRIIADVISTMKP